MDTLSQSPPRFDKPADPLLTTSHLPDSRPVKVTYAKKQKRKRALSRESDIRSNPDSEISEEEVDAKPKSVSKNSPSKSKKMSPPDSTARSVGASKRARVDSYVRDDVSVKSKKHVRGASSIASLKQLQPSSNLTPPSAKKPASVRGHKPISSISQKNPVPPSESAFDDGASIADSVISINRVRRTEAERIEYFKNQPECGSLEPNRAKCLRCHKYVALGKQTSYNVRPWEKHRANCDLKPATPHPGTPEAEGASEPVATPPTRKTEEERKAILLADPSAQEVKPDQVLCKNCQSWIRLSSGSGKVAYSLSNWKSHLKKCGSTIPSSRVATVDRKLKLVNDPRAKSFDTTYVVCASCDEKIELATDCDYDLTRWEEHKADCTESGSKVPATKAPASVGSSSTVVSPDSPESPKPPRGVKRRLDDSDDVDLAPDDPDARPQNRPRTEGYVAVEKEPPSVLGWFMMPFKSFVRGFKESLNKDASTQSV